MSHMTTKDGNILSCSLCMTLAAEECACVGTRLPGHLNSTEGVMAFYFYSNLALLLCEQLLHELQTTRHIHVLKSAHLTVCLLLESSATICIIIAILINFPWQSLLGVSTPTSLLACPSGGCHLEVS